MVIKTFIAGEDLTDKVGYAVIASSTNKQVILADDANDVCLGILTDDGILAEAVAVSNILTRTRKAHLFPQFLRQRDRALVPVQLHFEWDLPSS